MNSTYHQRFEKRIDAVEKALEQSISRSETFQKNLLTQGLGLGVPSIPGITSKRLRGVIATLACSASNNQTNWEIFPAVPELIHAASLIVDDIQDGHQLRWNRPAVWTSAGTPLAINMAFSILALAQSTLDELGIRTGHSLANILMEMLDGQARDLQAEQFYSGGLPEYLRIIRGKTGVLLNFSIEVGGHQLPRDTLKSLCEWASCLGIAHQIQDDIDDIIEDISLPKSHLHWFLASETPSTTKKQTLDFSLKLAAEYVEHGLLALKNTNIPELLKDDFSFILKKIGQRHSRMELVGDNV